MERVAELVEEGFHLVEGQQRRGRFGRLGEVHHQRHQRTGLLAVDDLRTAELGHPCPGTLRFAGKEVQVEYRHETAVLVGHVVGRHVGMVHLDLVVGREIQPVELVGEHEDALADVFKFEIRFHQLVVERIFLVLVLLVVIAPVPRHELAFESERSGIVADGLIVPVGIGFGLGKQLVEEGHDRRGVLGHAAFEHVVGIAFIAQQVGDLQAQVGDLFHDQRIVVLAAQCTRIVGTPEFLLERTVRRIGQERHIARRLQRHRPALFTARLGIGGHALLHEVRQFGHDLRIGDVDREGIGRSQGILAELERCGRQLGRILAVELLVRVGQGGTVACEALVGILEQFLVLFREAAAGFPVDCLHAGDEFGGERDVVRQFGQLGLHAQCDLLHFVRRIRFEQVEEDTRATIQQRTVALQSHDGIAEGRLRGVGDDRVDLGMRAGDGRVERRLVVREFDLGERRGLVGRIPLGQQGVRSI